MVGLDICTNGILIKDFIGSFSVLLRKFVLPISEEYRPFSFSSQLHILGFYSGRKNSYDVDLTHIS